MEHVTQELRDSEHMLAVCDGDVLTTIGHSRIIDELAEINFRTGGKWNEDTADTNGVGTALTERRTVEIVGAEHYVQAWQRWVCTAAAIRGPLSGEIIAVLDVTDYKEHATSHSVLAVCATATLIEQRLLLELTIEEKMLVEALLERSPAFRQMRSLQLTGVVVRFGSTPLLSRCAHPRGRTKPVR